VLEPSDVFQADYEAWIAEAGSVASSVYHAGAGGRVE